MPPRVDTQIRERVLRALQSGRCIDCHGKRQRENHVGRTVSCPTCSAAGRLESMSVAQLSNATALALATTLAALLDLEERKQCRVDVTSGVELWSATAPSR